MKNQKPVRIIISFFVFLSFGQTFAQFNYAYPQNLPQGLPGNFQMYPQSGMPNQRYQNTTSQQVSARRLDDVILTQEESIKDSIRTKREAELAEETDIERKENKTKDNLRKRIFGYSLFNNNKFDTQPNLNIATPNNYILGPSDQMVIELSGYTQKSMNPTITPDGYIRLDNVGVVYVSGLSIEQAKDKIVSKLSQVHVGLKSYNGYPPNTFATISLGSPRTVKVTILGEVVRPGTYNITSLSTALNALYLSGGPNEIGSFRNIQVIRQNRVVATLDLYDLLLNGIAKNNILLQDQDHIKINPYKMRIDIDGNVKRPGIYEPLAGENLEKAIYYAGGFTPDAYTHRLKIIRTTGREQKIADVSSESFKDFIVENGDSMYVEKILKRFENSVKIEGAVFRPGQYSLDDSQTLTQLINASESLKSDAFTNRISILRTNEDLTVSNISVDLSAILTGKASDIPLKREDIITVPSVFDLTESSFVRIQGAINFKDKIRSFPYVKNMTIEDLIVKAGGLKESASLSRVEIVRRKRNIDPNDAGASISDTYQFDITADLKVRDTKKSFYLYPFDEIFVRTSPNYYKQTFVIIDGEVMYPDEYGIKSKDEKISDLVKRAGGLTPLAYVEGASLVRKIRLTEDEITLKRKTIESLQDNTSINNKLKIDEIEAEHQESIGIDLKRILENPNGNDDMILQDGDVIKIPKRLETVKIQGEVLHPSTIKFSNNLSFTDYISRTGGYTSKSLRRRAYVMYPNGTVYKTNNFLFIHIYPKIHPGSEIVVPSKTLVNAQESAARLQTFVSLISATLSATTTFIAIQAAIKANNN